MAVSTSHHGVRTITEGPLKVELSPELEICLVRASGELDCINAPVLDAQLHRLLTSTELRSVILDLSELEFIDSIGVECLLKATQCVAREWRSSADRRGPSARRPRFGDHRTRQMLPFLGTRPTASSGA